MQERYTGRREGKIRAWSATEFLITENSDAALNLQADFDTDPEIYTIQFGVSDFQVAVPALGDKLPLATVDWTVYGNTVRRSFNIVDGTIISGTGQAARIKVVDQSQNFGGGFSYSVSALITPGVRPSVLQPPILRGDIALINGGGSQLLVDIPSNSGVTSAFIAIGATTAAGAPIDNDEILVSFATGNPGAIVMSVDYTGCNRFIPVPPGARVVQILNRRVFANGEIRATVLFGVDG